MNTVKITLNYHFEKAKEVAAVLGGDIEKHFPEAEKDSIVRRLSEAAADKSATTKRGYSGGTANITAKTLDRLTPEQLASLQACWLVAYTKIALS